MCCILYLVYKSSLFLKVKSDEGVVDSAPSTYNMSLFGQSEYEGRNETNRALVGPPRPKQAHPATHTQLFRYYYVDTIM